MKTERLTALAFLLGVTAALVAAVAPIGSVTEGTGSPGGVIVTHTSHVSLFQNDGAWVLVVLSVPVLVALVPVLVRRRAARVASAVLLWMGCVVGMWSVGVFFLPAAIVMTVAATRHDPAPAPPVSLLVE